MMEAQHEDLQWRRSSACESGGCLEMAQSGEAVLIRKSDAPEEVLSVSRLEWSAFLAGVRSGDFG
jgi:hypothetical protein